MTEVADKIECRACGQGRDFEEFRVFSTDPPMVFDFCAHCERQEGTLTLYRRFSGYGTPEIASAVYRAQRTPVGRRSAEQVRLLIEPKAIKAVVTKEDIVDRELQRRELCRRSLLYFTTTFDPTYTPGWVHQDIARRLEKFMRDIEAGLAPRLMIFMPPRAGKSKLASDMGPSWMLGHHPEWEFIEASHGLDLPVGFSRNIRDRIRDPEYQAIFPDTKVRSDSSAVETWKTTKNGGYLAAGIGVGITGKGFHVGIVDDPIKDFEAAQSETIRANTWNWFQSVFYTRKAPGAGILLIQTRWHDADVAGMLVQLEAQLRRDGTPEEQMDRWEVVSYPAIAEADETLLKDGTIWRGPLPEDAEPSRLLRKKGDALHPERFSLNELMKTKNTVAKAIWQAMYQQNPTPDEGDYFKKADFRYRVLDPEWIQMARVFITADYALGKKQRNDFTVVAVYALTAEDDLFVLDIIRGRGWSTGGKGNTSIVHNIVELIKKWKPEVYAGEQGQVHNAVWPLVEKELFKERIYVSVDETLTPITDKPTRARPLQGRMQNGKFFFSYAASKRPEEIEAVEHEMLRFPDGVNDDIVDCFAWGARLALNLPLPQTAAPPQRQSWMDRLNTSGAVGGTSHMAA